MSHSRNTKGDYEMKGYHFEFSNGNVKFLKSLGHALEYAHNHDLRVIRHW